MQEPLRVYVRIRPPQPFDGNFSSPEPGIVWPVVGPPDSAPTRLRIHQEKEGERELTSRQLSVEE